MQVINSYRSNDKSMSLSAHNMALGKSGRSHSMQGTEFKRSAGLASQKGLIRDNSVFDETIHNPPKIDKKGFNLDKNSGREFLNKYKQNILARGENSRIPTWWNGKNLSFGNHGGVATKKA